MIIAKKHLQEKVKLLFTSMKGMQQLMTHQSVHLKNVLTMRFVMVASVNNGQQKIIKSRNSQKLPGSTIGIVDCIAPQ